MVVLQVVFRGESRGKRGGRKMAHVVEPACRKEGRREGGEDESRFSQGNKAE